MSGNISINAEKLMIKVCHDNVLRNYNYAVGGQRGQRLHIRCLSLFMGNLIGYRHFLLFINKETSIILKFILSMKEEPATKRRHGPLGG